MKKIFTFFVALLCAGTMMAFEGALNGAFTINASGDRIQFSQGNLQYVGTWQFAENQWDIIGDAQADDNRDLFGWGTGDAPNKVSTDNNDYADFVDWGVNPITNGGNEANAWRTLTSDEWAYILSTRATGVTVNSTDNARFTLANINTDATSVFGLIIFPDVFAGAATAGVTWGTINAADNNPTSCTSAGWAALEVAGAVFLPAAGGRYGTDVDDVGYGYYWSATPSGTNYAYSLSFYSYGLYPQDYNYRYCGFSVRLVIKIPAVGDTIVVDGVQYKVTSVTSGAKKVSVPKQDYTGTSLVIPAKVNYFGEDYAVTMVEQKAFQGNTSITSLDVAAEMINSFAFKECSNLANVTLREGVTGLYRDAFEGFAATSITLPASLTEIDEYGYYCPFPDNQLESIVVAAGNTHFVVGEDGALYNTDRTRIYAFPHNFSKPFKEIPSTVQIIHDDVFNDCTNIADTIIIPATLQRAASFQNSNVKCVILESNFLNVRSCFQRCSDLEEIIIGENVTQIGQLMFTGACNVKKITVLGETMPDWQYGTDTNWPVFGNYGGFCGGISPFTDAKVYVHCGLSGTYVADENKWANFTNVIDTLMYDIDVTAENATVVILEPEECNKVTITATPEEGFAFVNWDNGLTNPEITITVDKDTALTANIKKILGVGDTFFAATVEGVNVTYKILTKEPGNMTVQIGPKTGFGSDNGNAISKTYNGPLTIPETVNYYDETYTVVAVGGHAFYLCALTSLSLPNTVQTLDQGSIQECTSLTSVNIPEGITFIPRYNFSYMSSLTSLTLPTTLQYIGSGVFNYDLQLATLENWNPSQYLRVGSNIGAMDTKYFKENCIVENGLKYAGDILLGRVNYLESDTLVVKNGTRLIPYMAYNPNVKTIVFPSTLEAIGAESLTDYPVLESCTLNVATPPVVYRSRDSQDFAAELTANQIFTGTTPTDIKVYVPKAAVATYKANAKWNMLDIRPIGGWEIQFVDGDGNITTQFVEEGEMPEVPASATKTATDTKAYIFNGWDKTVVAATEDATYTAQFTEIDLITNVALTVEFPDTGDEIQSHGYGYTPEALGLTDLCPKDAFYHVDNIYFYNAAGGYFDETALLPGTTYIMQFYVAPNDHSSFKLREGSFYPDYDNMTFTVNDVEREYDVMHITWCIFSADFTTSGDAPTGIESVQDSDISIQKVVRDGQLLIIRGEKQYNAQGAQVK
ncbi:MAG: leucine-rich repeat protein [Paludibacteraceae bacterium]|nr:leucine-rich repeat protein [Paludibacteraceae bacterium]